MVKKKIVSYETEVLEISKEELNDKLLEKAAELSTQIAEDNPEMYLVMGILFAKHTAMVVNDLFKEEKKEEVKE